MMNSEQRKEMLGLLSSISSAQFGPVFRQRLEALVMDESISKMDTGSAALLAIPLFEELTRGTIDKTVSGAALKAWVKANIPFNRMGYFVALANLAESLADIILSLAMAQVVEELIKEKQDADDSGSRDSDTSGSSGDSGGSTGLSGAEREVRLGEREGDAGDGAAVESAGRGNDSTDREL